MDVQAILEEWKSRASALRDRHVQLPIRSRWGWGIGLAVLLLSALSLIITSDPGPPGADPGWSHGGYPGWYCGSNPAGASPGVYFLRTEGGNIGSDGRSMYYFDPDAGRPGR